MLIALSLGEMIQSSGIDLFTMGDPYNLVFTYVDQFFPIFHPNAREHCGYNCFWSNGDQF